MWPRTWVSPEGQGQWALLSREGEVVPGESWRTAEAKQTSLAEGRAAGLRGPALTATLPRGSAWLSESHWQAAQDAAARADIDALWALDEADADGEQETPGGV
jgi:hypothetical protein